MSIKVNFQERMYVIVEAHSYSCLGFDVLDHRAVRLAQELGLPFDVSLEHGEEKYYHYSKLQQVAHNRFLETGKRMTCELHPKLVGYHGMRVEVTFADGTKERFQIGKSTGWIPAYLRLHNRRSSGGGAIDRDEQIISVRQV